MSAINDFPSWQDTTLVFRLFAVGSANTLEPDLAVELEDEMRLRNKVKLGRAHGGCLGVERR